MLTWEQLSPRHSTFAKVGQSWGSSKRFDY